MSDNVVRRRPVTFRAVPIVTDTSEFEILSFDCWQDKIVIGCRDGSVRIFGPAPGNSTRFVPILERRNFASRAVEFLSIIDALNLVVSISDCVCYVHDLSSFASLGSLNTGGSRGFFIAANESCRARVADNPMHPFLLAVLSRSRLHIFEWKGTASCFELISAFNLSDRVTSAVFIHDNALCLAYRNRYEVLYLRTGRSLEFAVHVPEIMMPVPSSLYRRSRSPKKACGVVSEVVDNRRGNSIRVAIGVHPGSTIYTFPLNDSAAPIPSSIAIPIESAIVSMLLLPPFLLVVTEGGIHPVHVDLENGQSESIPFANAIAVRSKSKTMAFAASKNSITLLQRLSIEDQIDELCSLNAFDAALLLLRDVSETDRIVDVERRLRYVNSLYAKHLFEQGQYAAALKRFQQSNIDPRLVLSMYGELDDEALSSETISSIIPYLLHLRITVPREIDDPDRAADLAARIDTFLLNMYLKADRRLVIPFLTQAHCCDVAAAEQALVRAGEYEALLFLFKSRGLHADALRLLQSLHDRPETGFGGLQHTIAYLKQLLEDEANWPLVQDAAVWLLAADPPQAIRIFTDQYRRRSVVLALNQDAGGRIRVTPGSILQFLRERSTAEACVLFLESFIVLTGNTDAVFHNALADLYLEMAVGAGDALAPNRVHMQDFLMRSSCFDAAALLARFPVDLSQLPKERAILLHRCNRTEEALGVLARFDNPITAIEFCDTYNRSDLQLHMMLLRVFLDPNKGEPLLEPALQLLQTHTMFVDAVEAISLFPESLPVHRLKHFFEKTICLNLQQHRHYQVELQLLRREHRRQDLVLHQLLQQAVVVDGRGRCGHCHQTLASTATVVARTPSGTILDYSCCMALSNRLP